VNARAHARVLHIGPGAYATLSAAARDAAPGDTLLFSAGVHVGGAYISNLHGLADKWIVISGPRDATAVIEGGGTAIQLSDPKYVRIEHLSFRGQTANGVNIDDGGTYDTPASHVSIRWCVWENIAATGNNDLLKLSGLQHFDIQYCRFLNGAAGGSMVDMVGCHNGRIEDNEFINAGSNCIQAKGGTADVLIARNRFINGGQRAINIGGSTGLQYFRPQGANYEAARIQVYANLFRGSMAPIAYVGAVDCDVANNTILYPDKWVIRILQETTEEGFLQCGDNYFRNNLVIVDNRAISPSVNIGPNTLPGSFGFSHNLWYNDEQPSWQGPALTAPESNGIRGRNPRLRDVAANDVFPLPASPALANGLHIPELKSDLLGMPYNSPPSIGAVEGNPATTYMHSRSSPSAINIELYPQPARDVLHIVFENSHAVLSYALYDVAGRLVIHPSMHASYAANHVTMPVTHVPNGMYFLLIRSEVLAPSATPRLLPVYIRR